MFRECNTRRTQVDELCEGTAGGDNFEQSEFFSADYGKKRKNIGQLKVYSSPPTDAYVCGQPGQNLFRDEKHGLKKTYKILNKVKLKLIQAKQRIEIAW